MRRREFVGLLGSLAGTGCLGSTNATGPASTTRPITPVDRRTPTEAQSTTKTTTSTCAGPHHYPFGEWHHGWQFDVSVREVTAITSITVDAPADEPARNSLPSGWQLLLGQFAIRNGTDEALPVCTVCDRFGAMYQERFVGHCRSGWRFPDATVLEMDWIEETSDLPQFPPAGNLEPGSVWTIELGALVPVEPDVADLAIVFDGTGVDFQAHWHRGLEQVYHEGCPPRQTSTSG